MNSGLKKYALPCAAALLVIVAAVVIFAVPRGGVAETGGGYAERSEDGDLVIRASELSSDAISFYRFAEGSKIELIAIRGADGAAYAALGTCQSCNGSPNAYYTQNGGVLQCNNCGLTFPLSIIGADGAGCHPIMMDDSVTERSGDDLVIDAERLSAYEPLFTRVAEH
ncbi:MAG: DUF2318 domain-containing protein [Oscillospiraceae bacterium]|nr:DUF2318 domain-containing protein [Oscillospiraceae bacterium]